MIPRSLRLWLLLFWLGHDDFLHTCSSFQIITRQQQHQRITATTTKTTILHSTFAADRSEYDDVDDGDSEDDDTTDSPWNRMDDDNFDELTYDADEEGEVETEELSPVPLSKNAGNTFLALVLDRLLHSDPSTDVMEMHEQRVDLTEDHVMYVRKRNLYNATFNTDSMVDIPFSYQMYVIVAFPSFLLLYYDLCCLCS
jgi:hypothetical protein